ncbi:Hypothetical predicted protein [Pelobates cultripes]|uniref:Uncharacterized protein n=1 Tax=Pelobates cultripes TaxID=61616 RepID=A0AAD1SHH4_PELCU|nr:Hypothetical predicted protein [Pelobates cultripes]
MPWCKQQVLEMHERRGYIILHMVAVFDHSTLLDTRLEVIKGIFPSIPALTPSADRVAKLHKNEEANALIHFLRWKTEPPSITQWINQVEEVRVMEELHWSSRGLRGKYVGI